MEKFPIDERHDEEGKISRRDFLKLGLATAIGAATSIEVSAYEQKEVPVKHVEHTETSFNGNEAHKSGNYFADKVGNLLQENWKNGTPSKVTHPSVKVSVRDLGGKTEFKFNWHCDIETCERKDADLHFDRRGTLLSGRTLDEAKQKVEAELHSSNKVNDMMQSFDRIYGEHKMPVSFVGESSAQTSNGTWWYVKEFFCTANEKHL
jgi:hypothetical protein